MENTRWRWKTLTSSGGSRKKTQRSRCCRCEHIAEWSTEKNHHARRKPRRKRGQLQRKRKPHHARISAILASHAFFYDFSKSFRLATNVPTLFVFFKLGVVFKSKYIQISSFAIFHKIFRDLENFKVFQRRLGLSRGARFSTLCPEGYMVRLTQRSTIPIVKWRKGHCKKTWCVARQSIGRGTQKLNRFYNLSWSFAWGDLLIFRGLRIWEASKTDPSGEPQKAEFIELFKLISNNSRCLVT